MRKTRLFRVLILLSFLIINCYNSFSQLYINEFQARNIQTIIDKTFFNFGDWIELYNDGTSALNISGYTITDNPLVNDKWTIPSSTTVPAKGYLLIWADNNDQGLHTSFKLDADTGYIAIYNSSQILLDEVYYSQQYPDVSYGRFPDASSVWKHFAVPSPGKASLVAGIDGIQSDSVSFSVPGGFYNSPTISVSLSAAPGALIYYTLDGSIPTDSSTLYTVPINIGTTSVVRAISYEVGELPSDITTQSYFLYVHHTGLPIISITTNPEFLYDDSIGIYVEGVNGIDGRGMDYPVNWNQDWERPAHIEYYDTAQNLGFSCQFGLSIFGGWSRRNAQKSFTVRFRGDYGVKELEYPLFENRNNDDFKSFLLRNSGNDFNNTHLRDAVLQDILHGQMDIDLQAYEPTVVYINGQYWGIQNIREKLNEYYTENNHKANPDSVDIIDIDGWYDVKEGTMDHYDAMITYLENNDITQQQHYDYIQTQMDVGEFMNYNIVEMYYRNHDWPVKNSKWWRPQTEDGKWRWMLFDLDITTGIWGQDPTSNSVEYALSPVQTGANPPYSTYLLRRLMENQEFKDEFIRRFIYHINNTFNSDRINAFVDAASAEVEAEMPYHYARWGGSVSNWYGNLEQMKSFCSVRPIEVMQDLGEYFNLGNNTNLTLSRNINDAGMFNITNERIYDSLYHSLVLTDYRYKIKAIQNFGYEFNHWELTGIMLDTVTLISKEAAWKYLDDGTDQDTTWRETSFNDITWLEGNAILGYGEGNENTVINYGVDTNKYATYYFRKEFVFEDTVTFTDVFVNILRDDGAIVYLNGQEIIRTNMPGGLITSATYAYGATSGSDESRYFSFLIDKDLLHPDTNLIAIEVHQATPTSSDVTFDLEILGVWESSKNSYILNDSEIEVYFTGNTQLHAVYNESVDNNINLYINEVVARNSGGYPDEWGQTDDWIEIYNAGDTPVDISGFYLSDEKDDPYKCMLKNDITGALIIEPKGFLILWADASTSQGTSHLGFKLDNYGEYISMYFDDGNNVGYVDSLSFDSVMAQSVFGRYKDGSPEIYQLGIATPGSENILEYSSEEEIIAEIISIYPNPVSNILNISNIYSVLRIELIDLKGSVVVSENNEDQNTISIDVSNLIPGLYICSLSTKESKRIIKKIIVY